MCNLRCLIVITLLALSPLSAFAHHGSSGQFDTSQTFVVSGSITRVRLVNPHSYVYFDVKDDNNGVTNMRCELQSGSLLKRRGWTTELFEIGSHISILGSPDRKDPTTCYMNEITFENGITASRDSTFTDKGTIVSDTKSKDTQSSKATRQTTLSDGSPNINGNWAMVRERGAPPGAGGNSPIILTEAGKAAVLDAASSQNPRFHCEPTNIIMDWWFDQMVNHIEQTHTKIELTYGFMNLQRTIYLDGTSMPDDYQPSRAGFSTGKWTGDTLVVTTTGFDEGWIMAPLEGERRERPGDAKAKGERPPRPDADRPPRPDGARGRMGPPSPAKNSSQLTITERFTLNEDKTVLTREYTLVDPVNLEQPITGSDKVTFTEDSYEPYACDDLTTERTQNTPQNNHHTDTKLSASTAKSLNWLEESGLGLTVSSTQWGYPIALTLHAIGMGILVGVSLMLLIRVLGFAADIPIIAMAPYWRIAQGGFVINLLSGIALFSGNATELYVNWAFRIKLLLVFIGLGLTWWLVKLCMKPATSTAPKQTKIAALTLIVWVAAIIAGRLIGYWS
ncbi:DUF6152 family protein [Paraglaciecola sp. 2405UD69-4]|uniref:DUF6152 family protein n=1 Tax=Paraglaciecola sp. 2405UD69-4 TaxID=3391836 RepID=UPI0039C97EEC